MGPLSLIEADLEEIEAVLIAARSRLLRGQEKATIQLSRYEAVKGEYRSRRVRDRVFGDHSTVFGEPAWDILLDLYLAQLSGRQISISSACIASAAPASTALRHLEVLQKRGLLARSPDPEDHRRAFVSLTETGHTLMESWIKSDGA